MKKKKPKEGVVSGYNGCMCTVPSNSYTIFNLLEEEVECTATYEPKDICPEEKEKIHLPTLESKKLYFLAPPLIACTKITEVVRVSLTFVKLLFF